MMWWRFPIRTALLAGAVIAAPGPAAAQIALGETGLRFTGNAQVASDYLFRGISQTRSRVAYLTNLELNHTSGVYVGAFVANLRFAGMDARQEIDVLAGHRFTLAGFSLDIGGVWYTYPGTTTARGQYGLNYVEGVLKVSRDIGQVTMGALLAASPNFFASSGTGIYGEGGVDWRSGLHDIVLGGRLAYQSIARNARFGTPDYAWWGLTASRDFVIDGLGTINGLVGYYQTSIDRAQCVPLNGRGQDICGARAFGSLSFRF